MIDISKLAATPFQRQLQSSTALVKARKYVHVVVNACPVEFDAPGLQCIFNSRRDALRWMHEQQGKDFYGRQYWVVQRWRVK